MLCVMYQFIHLVTPVCLIPIFFILLRMQDLPLKLLSVQKSFTLKVYIFSAWRVQKSDLFLVTMSKLLCIRNNYQRVMVFSNLDMSFIIMFECSMSQIQLIKETPLQECSTSFLQLQHSQKNVCQDKMHKSNGRNTFATPSQFFSHSDSSSYIAHSYLEIEKDYLYQCGRIHYGNTLQELMV